MIPLSVAILVAVNVVSLNKLDDTNNKLVAQHTVVTETRNELKDTSQRLQELKTQKVKLDSTIAEERAKANEIVSENERLKENLQAKRAAEEQARLAAQAKPQVSNTPKPAAQTVNASAKPAVVGGNKASWLAASGIPESEWHHVDFIVNRESGWNPNAVNASSGACGLGQQLPCGKWAGAWNDPVAALKAQYGYVQGRYGSYANAVAFWHQNSWY